MFFPQLYVEGPKQALCLGPKHPKALDLGMDENIESWNISKGM